jgi:hypothetical protein
MVCIRRVPFVGDRGTGNPRFQTAHLSARQSWSSAKAVKAETGGAAFVFELYPMEFVDGESLDVLVQRFGRLEDNDNRAALSGFNLGSLLLGRLTGQGRFQSSCVLRTIPFAQETIYCCSNHPDTVVHNSRWNQGVGVGFGILSSAGGFALNPVPLS